MCIYFGGEWHTHRLSYFYASNNDMIKLVTLFLLAGMVVEAQQPLPIPLNIQSAYDKETRTHDGKPGKNYWQNSADYTLHINYNPDTRLLSGAEEITYTNNSPDTLSEIVFKLYPNVYQKGNTRDFKIQPGDLTDGVAVESILMEGITREAYINGTNMTIPYTKVLPRQSVRFSIQYHYTLNEHSHNRTGEVDKGSAFIAYFFPRIAVYDDIDGWNKNPYTGEQEFYNDFCNFNVSVTVPRDYLVWATGDLLNSEEVLNRQYVERLKAAEQKEERVFIVDETDLKNGAITKPGDTLTWKFKAENVVDVAFALSNHYVWNATSLVVDKKTGRRTRVDAVFNTEHKDYFEALEVAAKTVELMSDRFPHWPFPYNHETVFDGLDQMEYPMMVNDNPVPDRFDLITLADHEIFHTMFPFYMGINETKYGWMDEGWATLGEWLLSPMIDSTAVDDYGMDRYLLNAGKEIDAPIISLSTLLNDGAYVNNSYEKPAMGYLYVKEMLGDKLFLKALHYYIAQWHGKHPAPLDFFNCINTGSGKNLNWFWKNWFYEGGYPDLAINKVIQQGNTQKISISRKGNKMVPVEVIITYADGSTQTIRRSIAAWEKNNKTMTLTVSAPQKIKEITLGGRYIPDVNKTDNTWKAD